MSRSPAQTLGALAFVVCVIGVFLPWSHGVVGLADSSGLDGAGAVALLFAAVGAIALFASNDKKMTLLAVGCAAITVMIGILGYIGVQDEIDKQVGDFNDILGIFDEEAKIGIGVYVLIGGAVAALVCSLAQLAMGGSKRTTSA